MAFSNMYRMLFVCQKCKTATLVASAAHGGNMVCPRCHGLSIEEQTTIGRLVIANYEIFNYCNYCTKYYSTGQVQCIDQHDGTIMCPSCSAVRSAQAAAPKPKQMFVCVDCGNPMLFSRSSGRCAPCDYYASGPPPQPSSPPYWQPHYSFSKGPSPFGTQTGHIHGGNTTTMPPNNSPKVKIWWDDQIDAYRMSSAFDKGFVESLKKLIPDSDRNWDPSSRIWTFSEKWLPPMTTLCNMIWRTPGSVQIITKQNTAKASCPPATRGTPINDLIVRFVTLVGFDAMQKAYRAASLTHHPDRGGDMETMAKINECWTRIESELWKR